MRTLARRLGLSALAEALLLTGRVRVRVTASVKTRPYDEALALPTEDAVRIALRTQKIIVHETGVADTIDPLGDADFVEALTDEVECEADRSRARRRIAGAVEHRLAALRKSAVRDGEYLMPGPGHAVSAHVIEGGTSPYCRMWDYYAESHVF